MTHAELVERAKRWLKSQRCRVIVSDANSNSNEQPDALGWIAWGTSILVECKASRADFLADANKPFRIHPALGMGCCRYFMSAPSIIGLDDLPEGWGLVEVHGRSVRILRKSSHFPERNLFNEIKFLVRHGTAVEPLEKVFNGSHI